MQPPFSTAQLLEKIAHLRKTEKILRGRSKNKSRQTEDLKNKVVQLRKVEPILRDRAARQAGELKTLREQLPDAITGCLLSGGDWTAACVANTRLLIDRNRKVDARLFAYAMLEQPTMADAGYLGLALVAHSVQLYFLMREALSRVPANLVVEHVPAEYLEMLFEKSPEEAAQITRSWLDQFPALSPEVWLKAACFAEATKNGGLATEIVERLHQPSCREKMSAESLTALDWMRKMLAPGRKKSGHKDASTQTTITLGVLNYDSVDYARSSINLGEYTQTVAFLSNLARFQNLTFSGDESLAKFMASLRKKVFADRLIDGPALQVELVPVNRDASSRSELPGDTWLIAHGSFLESLLNLRYDFPFQPSLRPLFFSFHLHRPEMLTDETLAYLREKGPIGCRDWNTVDLLLNLGVDAFFSGCLSTTLDNILRAAPQPAVPERPRKIAYVNASAAGEKGRPRHALSALHPEILGKEFTEKLAAAVAQLEEYARYDLVVTSRLQCFLPATAMGVKVDFQPLQASDTRLEGLAGLTTETIGSVRDPLLVKLQLLLEKILAGTSEKEVYAWWRDLCAPDVARARAYCAPPPVIPCSFDLDGATAQILAASKIVGPAPAAEVEDGRIDVAFSTDANLKEQLLVVLESALEHASRPLRVWLLTRGLGPGDFSHYQTVFPEMDFQFLPCDEVDHGAIGGLIAHTTVATMDRLLLPALIPRQKVVYLDIDLLILDDLAKLLDLPLDESPLAARTSENQMGENGYNLVQRSAKRLDASRATELRRRMHRRYDLRFPIHNAGVLVMNLEKMRADRFYEEFFPFVARYGMNDQDVLTCYVGSRLLKLDPAWNCITTQDLIDRARIIHWTGAAKPWNNRWVPGRAKWESCQAALRGRIDRT